MEDPVGTIQTNLWASWVNMRVTAVFASLGIADVLQPKGASKSCKEMAVEVEAHPDSLYRMLRTAVVLGLVQELRSDYENPETDPNHARGTRRFVLTPMGECLAENHPSQMKFFMGMFGMPMHLALFDKLQDCVKTNVMAPKHAFGVETPFELLDRFEEEGQVFNRAMSSVSSVQSKIVARAYDFSKHKKAVDVGGSYGVLMQHILDTHPGLPEGINFDRKEVLDKCPPLPAGSRLRHVVGDFFQPLPSEVHGADVLTMKFILHDWDDDKCRMILKHCKEALAPGGRIVNIDMVMGDATSPTPPHLMQCAMDMNMLIMCGGRERTLQEWKHLAASVGLALVPNAEGSLVWGEPPAQMIVMEAK